MSSASSLRSRLRRLERELVGPMRSRTGFHDGDAAARASMIIAAAAIPDAPTSVRDAAARLAQILTGAAARARAAGDPA